MSNEIYEYNHFFKKSLLVNWLIDINGDKKFYMYTKNQYVTIGSHQKDVLFSLKFFSKSDEDKISVNHIENKFCEVVQNFINNIELNNIALDFDLIPNDSKRNKNFKKINNPDTLNKIKSNFQEKNINSLFDIIPKYLALQLQRLPPNLVKSYNEFKLISNKIKEHITENISQSAFSGNISNIERLWNKPNVDNNIAILNQTLFNNFDSLTLELFRISQNLNIKVNFDCIKKTITKPIEIFFIHSKTNIFNLSQANTFSLQIRNCNEYYITAISPKILLLINCSDNYLNKFDLSFLENNIEVFWNKNTQLFGFDIILANKEYKVDNPTFKQDSITFDEMERYYNNKHD